MKKDTCAENLVLIAAFTIIASSVSSIVGCRRRSIMIRESIKEAVQTWEAEGGPVVEEREELTA